MKEKGIFRFISILVIAGILASGCANTTVLQTNPSDASVYIKGEKVGTTPYTHKDMKIAGASTLITFKKEGYEDYSTTLRKVEKWNIGALIGGLFLIYPLFWILGYDEVHTYDLFEAVERAALEPEVMDEEIVEEETEVLPVVVDESDLITADDALKNQRVERLLEQGRTDRALEYTEKQEGEVRDACYYTLADYYLAEKDITAAEDYYTKAGKTSEGHVKIADMYLRGFLIDSVYIIDEHKAITYLRKVYDNEETVDKHMAVGFEKFAAERMKRLELLKVMKDQGISGIGDRSGWVDINIEYALARLMAEIYLDRAIAGFDKLEYFDKSEELKNKLKELNDEYPPDKESEDRLKSKINFSH